MRITLVVHPAFDDMEREWKIGRVINLLNNPTFMFTGPCIRSKTKKVFAGAWAEVVHGSMVIVHTPGMFIRRIEGVTCDKIVGDAKFADIRWLRKCLFTVLMALDEAQKLLGFQYVAAFVGGLICTNILCHHCFCSHFDFRLGNIMVTGPTKEDWVNAEKAQFKVCASSQDRPF